MRESELYYGNGSNSERREGSLPSLYLKEEGGEEEREGSDVGWSMKKKRDATTNAQHLSTSFDCGGRDIFPNATEVDGA